MKKDEMGWKRAEAWSKGRPATSVLIWEQPITNRRLRKHVAAQTSWR